MPEIDFFDENRKLNESRLIKYNALQRLKKSDDYIDVIEKGYIIDEIQNIIISKNDLTDKEILDKINAIVYFKSYLERIQKDNMLAEKELIDLKRYKND